MYLNGGIADRRCYTFDVVARVRLVGYPGLDWLVIQDDCAGVPCSVFFFSDSGV